MCKFSVLMALGLVKVAPKLIFGDCPDVDSVTTDGWASNLVGKWHVPEQDVDIQNQSFFLGCYSAEFKLEDTSNKNLLKGYLRAYNFFGFKYESFLVHA